MSIASPMRFFSGPRSWVGACDTHRLRGSWASTVTSADCAFFVLVAAQRSTLCDQHLLPRGARPPEGTVSRTRRGLLDVSSRHLCFAAQVGLSPGPGSESRPGIVSRSADGRHREVPTHTRRSEGSRIAPTGDLQTASFPWRRTPASIQSPPAAWSQAESRRAARAATDRRGAPAYGWRSSDPALAGLLDFRDGTSYTGLNPERRICVKHIGITGHANSPILMRAVRLDNQDVIDTVLMALNANDRQSDSSQNNILPLAVARGMGGFARLAPPIISPRIVAQRSRSARTACKSIYTAPRALAALRTSAGSTAISAPKRPAPAHRA